MKEKFYGFILVPKKYQYYMFLKINVVIKESPYSTKKITLCRHTFKTNIFLGYRSPCGLENSHNVIQFNPDEEKYYLLTPYPTLMQPLKKFLPKSIRAIARNPNIDLQSIGIYSKSDIQHHIRTQKF